MLVTKSEHEKEESRGTEGARRGTGVAREAGERNGEAPDPEVADKTTRRRFTAAYKRRIVREADKCTKPGEVGGRVFVEPERLAAATRFGRAGRDGSEARTEGSEG